MNSCREIGVWLCVLSATTLLAVSSFDGVTESTGLRANGSDFARLTEPWHTVIQSARLLAQRSANRRQLRPRVGEIPKVRRIVWPFQVLEQRIRL